MQFKIDISKGVNLDSFDILIEWEINRKAFLEKTKHLQIKILQNDKFNYCGYTVDSKLLGVDQMFKITFNFVGDTLTSVNIFDIKEEINVLENYEKIQKILELNFGVPKSCRRNKKEITSIWKFQKIKITHAIYEGFVVQEILEFKNNNRSKRKRLI